MGGKPGRSGGKRSGAGRKLSSLTLKSRRVAEIAASKGKTPLEYVLSVMNDETADLERRDWAAETAMAFVHPRLVMVARTDDKPRTVNNITVEFIAPQGYAVDSAGKIVEHEPLRIEPERESETEH
jgi:hypothetical protein